MKIIFIISALFILYSCSNKSASRAAAEKYKQEFDQLGKETNDLIQKYEYEKKLADANYRLRQSEK